MKKIFLTLIVALNLFLPLQLCLAAEHHYLAQVQIDTQLMPSYAANIDVSAAEQKKGGVANTILQLIAGSIIYLAGPTAVLLLAIGGLRYVTAHGNQPQMDAAKKTITYAIIGLLIMALSMVIISNVIQLVTSL